METKKLPIRRYLKNHTKAQLARDLKFTPGAIGKMLSTDRDLTVVFNEKRAKYIIETRIIKGNTV